MVVVVENVPDMMNQGGQNFVARMCASLAAIGYECRYSLINAAHFGVPQFRERVFILGFHSSLAIVPKFPRPTHQLELPCGYLGTRSVAMRPMVESGMACEWFVELSKPRSNAPPAVTCREALSDLPSLTEHLSSDRKHGTRSFTEHRPYPLRSKLSDFARSMRTWRGFENDAGICDHVIRFLPRDYETFRRMKVDDQYPQAFLVAQKRFLEALNDYEDAPAPGSREFNELWKQFVPPYDPNKFPNKWWKLHPDKPSKTLTAHIGKDTYSHIHYDSRQARTISVREAARLQSFPDGFVFSGAMNAAFRQIGNAVPPLLACAVGRQVRRQLLQQARRSMLQV